MAYLHRTLANVVKPMSRLLPRQGLFLAYFLCLNISLLSFDARAQATGSNSNTPVTTQKLSASLRLGLAYRDLDSNSGDYSLSDFGSRISWQGQTQLAVGLMANGYLELALDSDDNSSDNSGIDRTRQLWAGLSGGWGSLRVGAQYGSFYDLISVHTDVATWGSCWTQAECSRKTRVLKYQGPLSPLVFALSGTASAEDDGNDALDQIEYGFNYRSDALVLGVAAVTYAGEAGYDGGNTVGAVLKADLGGWAMTVGYQKTDQSIAVGLGTNPGATGDVTNLTFGLTYINSYLIYNKGDTGNTEPNYLTIGMVQNLANSAALSYEYQQVDNDDSGDSETYVRAVFRYDW